MIDASNRLLVELRRQVGRVVAEAERGAEADEIVDMIESAAPAVCQAVKRWLSETEAVRANNRKERERKPATRAA